MVEWRRLGRKMMETVARRSRGGGGVGLGQGRVEEVGEEEEGDEGMAEQMRWQSRTRVR